MQSQLVKQLTNMKKHYANADLRRLKASRLSQSKLHSNGNVSQFVFTEMAPEPAYGGGCTNSARLFTCEMSITLGCEWLRTTPAHGPIKEWTAD